MDWKFNWINYESILSGSNLEIEMGNKELVATSNNESVYALKISPTIKIVPAPAINSISRVFDDSLLITLSGSNPFDKLYFGIMDAQKNQILYKLYVKPFTIYKSQKIYAFAENDKNKSVRVEGEFFKRPNNWKVQIQ